MREPVLVLGATSLVGRFLLPLAAERGMAVTALSRTPPPGEVAGGLRWIAADLGASDLEAQLPESRTVLSLSPIWLSPQALPALQARGMTRLVAFSSTSRITKADSPVPEEREVARKLAEAETATIAFCEAHGVGWTILRPTLIYAEGLDQNVSRLAALIRRFRWLPLSGRGEGLRQPVHAADLARAALDAADNHAAAGRLYDLPGGETLSYRRMAERIFEGLELRPRIVPIPPALWRLGLRLAAPLLPGATSAMGDRMAEDLAFDPEPARRDFGWSPRLFHPDFSRRQDPIRTGRAP